MPHPGPGSLPAALMSVETEAQATRGFVHVRLAHGCSLGVAQGHPEPHLDGFLGWGDGLQRCHGIMPLPPYPLVSVSTAPVVLQPTRTKPRGVPRCPWGCCAARGAAQQAKQAWGQMGTEWGQHGDSKESRVVGSWPCALLAAMCYVCLYSGENKNTPTTHTPVCACAWRPARAAAT